MELISVSVTFVNTELEVSYSERDSRLTLMAVEDFRETLDLR